MPRGERLFTMTIEFFREVIKNNSDEELLKTYVASQIEESKNFLKADWQKENGPFIKIIKDEILKRMGN